MRGAYIDLTNAFFAIGGFVLAVVGMFGVLCVLGVIYLAIREKFWAYVAAKAREDAGYDWSDPYGDIPSPITDPDGADVLHVRENY